MRCDCLVLGFDYAMFVKDCERPLHIRIIWTCGTCRFVCCRPAHLSVWLCGCLKAVLVARQLHVAVEVSDLDVY